MREPSSTLPAAAPQGSIRRSMLHCALASAVLCVAGSAGASPAAAIDARSTPVASAAGCERPGWPLWEAFAQRHIQSDGRVVDHATQRLHSTSEGQSYAMLFALVAHDRPRFELLWRWSVANLMDGQVGKQLPAWQWGRRDDGSWGVVDANSASDADLWFVYALAEAGRLWQVPQYTQDALALLPLITAEEVADLPGLGAMLLPGRSGFATLAQQWRINPSYMPLPVLRRLAQLQPSGPWKAIARNSVQMLVQNTPQGFAPDWVIYRATVTADAALDPRGAAPDATSTDAAKLATSGTFMQDSETGDLGSYEAIRVYLWAGMTAPGDPLAAPLLKSLGGMSRALSQTGLPPEKVHTRSASTSGAAPVGFSAALLPFLRATGQPVLLRAQRARAQAGLWPTAPLPAPTYYDYVLGLFGSGWDEQRYQFMPSGRLKLRSEKACLPQVKKL